MYIYGVLHCVVSAVRRAGANWHSRFLPCWLTECNQSVAPAKEHRDDGPVLNCWVVEVVAVLLSRGLLKSCIISFEVRW